MSKYKIIQPLFLFFLSITFLAFFGRSFLFLFRTIKDLKTISNKQQIFFPEIMACSPIKPGFTAEQIHLWKYRNLGEKCQK